MIDNTSLIHDMMTSSATSIMDSTSLINETSSPSSAIPLSSPPPDTLMVTAAAQSMTNLSEADIQKYLEFYDGMYIHPFYHQYLEDLHNMPDMVYYFVGIYIACVCTLAMMGNLLVMYIFCT